MRNDDVTAGLALMRFSPRWLRKDQVQEMVR